MSDEKDQPLVKTDESDNTEQALQKLENVYAPLEHLSRDQQKYVNAKVFTNLTKSEIGELYGFSNYKMKQWDKDSYCQAFEKECQKEYQKDTIDKLTKQNTFIQNRVFMDLMDRLRQPDPENDLPEDATISEKQKYLSRFFTELEAKEAFKLWKEIDKRARLDSPDAATERIEDNKFVAEVKRRRRKVEKKRKKYQELKKEAEEKYKDEDNSVEVTDEDGNEIEADLYDEDDFEDVTEETETFEMEEYIIKRDGE